MIDFKRQPLVDTEWLAAHLDDDDVKVIDSSFYLPAEKRDPRAEYAAAHIPGAVFFDIDEVADKTIPLPHMFPSPETFDAAAGALGIGNGDTVISYDGGKLTGACRAWWMFRAFGHDRVAVLDGGMSKWRAEGRAVSADPVAPAPATYRSTFDPAMVQPLDAMMNIVAEGSMQVLDARSAGRFTGTAPEPRQGLRSGHMPGALNLPYDRLLRDDGTLRPPEELRDLFTGAGIDLGGTVVTSCGSGVSAAVLLLGLYALGHHDNTLYDGSWSEWGNRDDTPVVT